MERSEYSDWIGRREVVRDQVTEVPARALAATLNRTDLTFDRGAPLPGLWTWLYFLPLAPMAEVGSDGHPKRGGFLPPVDLPRRMWAGSRCKFHSPVRIGDEVERISTISKVAEKEGKTGLMVFVTVRHEISAGGRLSVEEEHDIVYIQIPDRFVPPAPIPFAAPDWREEVKVDPVLLFRFSALTFNGHRIHYDRSYTVDVEHYPGLVVHGPLQAVLLFNAATRRHPGRTPARFDFRGMRPLFDFDAITLNGRTSEDGGLDLCTATAEGGAAMQATLAWSE